MLRRVPPALRPWVGLARLSKVTWECSGSSNRRSSGVSAWCVAFGNEVPEAQAVTGHDLVECVDDPRSVYCAEHVFRWPRQPDLGQERGTAPGVTCDRSSVAEDEPKASEPHIFGHAGKQAAGLLIV